MIVITGVTGFIGGNLAMALSANGKEIVGVKGDHGVKDEAPLGCREIMHKSEFLAWLHKRPKLEAVLHMGACTDTTCQDWKYLLENNTRFTARTWHWCCANDVKLIYASSAATYGDGARGFSDDHHDTRYIRPINKYGWSKYAFDRWALYSDKERFRPPSWAGLKFFNVYGPGEAHKGEMASMPSKLAPQVREGKVRLFNFGDQSRDFIHVSDVVDVIVHMLDSEPRGLYNVGTGVARTFNDLAGALFRHAGKTSNVDYYEMPDDIKKAYQTYTCADMTKLRKLGFSKKFKTLEEGVALLG